MLMIIIILNHLSSLLSLLSLLLSLLSSLSSLWSYYHLGAGFSYWHYHHYHHYHHYYYHYHHYVQNSSSEPGNHLFTGGKYSKIRVYSNKKLFTRILLYFTVRPGPCLRPLGWPRAVFTAFGKAWWNNF